MNRFDAKNKLKNLLLIQQYAFRLKNCVKI